MSTTLRNAATAVFFAAALLWPSAASAQPDGPRFERPNGMTEREYQNRKKELRDEIDRVLAELARFGEHATGFEGVWRITGTRTFVRRAGEQPQLAPLEGEVVMTAKGEVFEIKGKVSLVGGRGNRWQEEGSVAAGGWELVTRYDSTIGKVGDATYERQQDGSLTVRWASDEQEDGRPKARGVGRGERVFGDMDQADVEKRLFELNRELQYLRYPRPEPTSYDARSGKVKLRFTPTVEYDPDGVEQQVVDMIGEATTSIDLCLFEFALPRVAHALVAAHQRGVKVRMVYDDREEEQPAVHIIEAAGIATRSDARSALMHNKFIVIDGERVWTGSTNVAPGGIYVADNHAFTFESEGLAAIYTREFEEMFTDNAFGPTSPKNTDHTPVEIDRYTSVEVWFAPEDGAMDRLVEVVKTAKRSIKFMAFAYTSEALYNAMLERMQDGVEVTGVFESRHAGWKDIKTGPLHAAGATVRFDRNPDTLHHKVLIIDGETVISGSFNFTDSADRSNDENMFIVRSRSVARAFERELERIISVTDPDDERIPTAGMDSSHVASRDADDDAASGEPAAGIVDHLGDAID